MQRTSNRRRLREGFSLLELGVAIAILVVAIFGMMAAMASSTMLRQTSQETEVVAQQLQEQLQEFRSRDMSALSGFIPQHTPWPPVTATDATELWPAGASPFPFDRNAIGAAQILSEAEASIVFAADLDGDGTPGESPDDEYDLDRDGTRGENDANSNRAAYTILIPIRIHYRWRTLTGGTRTMEAATMIYPTSNN